MSAASALAALKSYAWPGNVRELKNTIERVLILEADEEIRREHLPLEVVGPARDSARGGSDPFPAGRVRPLEEIERLAIVHSLGVCDGNKTRAAQALGISRQTLRTKLKELHMDDEAEAGSET